MIIVGYQGIGKTTLASTDLRFIDLESSCFKYGDPPVRDENWYQAYCNMAINLSNAGRDVFVSSHKEVRDYLRKASEAGLAQVVAFIPALELKDQWIQKLRDRYSDTGLNKDKFALLNAEDRYTENIEEIRDSGLICFMIPDIDYNLGSLIDNSREMVNVWYEKGEV